jgi:DNA-binding PadR family transcriptional regulator
MPMVPHATFGLHDHKVEPQRQMRQGRAIGQRTAIEQAECGRPNAGALAVIDRLLWQAEPASGAPADLDDHERGRRTRVDRHEIELVATDMDVPGQDGPTGFREARGDEALGGITRLLCRRPHRVVGSVRHRAMVPSGPYLLLTPGPSQPASSGLLTHETRKAYISPIDIAVIVRVGSTMEPKVPEFGRFAEPSLLILVSLADGPKHGYAIMQDVERGTGRPMGAGTLYAALARLEERGLIEPLAPIDRRRPYRLTAVGAANLAEQLRGLSEFAQMGLRQLGETPP